MPITVLVVDDSIVMRALFSEVLDRIDGLICVGVARSADEARGMIGELDPDVITLDVEMPGVSGLEFLKEIMAETPRPVVMLSTLMQDDSKERDRAISLGAAACFPKPMSAGPEEMETVFAGLGSTIKDASRSLMEINQPRLDDQPEMRAV